MTTTDSWPSSRRRVDAVSRVQAWSVTGMMLLLYVISWADKSIIGVAGQSLIEDLHLTQSQFGFVGSAFYFLFSLSCLYVGFAADRLRLKWVLLAMCAIWSVTQIPVLLSTTFTALLISRIVLGAAEGPSSSLAHVTAYTWFPNEKRGLPAGLITSGASVAKMALAPVLAVIVAAWSWHAAFLTLAVVGGAWCLAWLVLGRTGPYTSGAEAAGIAERRVPMRQLLASKSFLGCCAGYFGHYALAAVVLTWLPSFLETVHGYSRAGSGAMLALPSVFAVAGLVGVGVLTDRLIRRGWTGGTARGRLGGMVVTLGGVLVVAGAILPVPFLSILMISLGYGLGASVYALCNPAVAQLVPAGQRSATIGAMTAIGSLGGVLGPVVTGWILDASPSPGTGYLIVFVAFGALLVVGAAIYTLFVRPERDQRRLDGTAAPGA